MWKKVKNNVVTIQLGEEPELRHIIKTGFSDKYMVVSEDAYQLDLGTVLFGTKEKIEKLYGIKLDEPFKDHRISYPEVSEHDLN